MNENAWQRCVSFSFNVETEGLEEQLEYTHPWLGKYPPIIQILFSYSCRISYSQRSGHYDFLLKVCSGMQDDNMGITQLYHWTTILETLFLLCRSLGFLHHSLKSECLSCLGYLHKMNDTSWNKQDKSAPRNPFLSTEYWGSIAYLDQKSIFHMFKVIWDKPHHFSTLLFLTWISVSNLGITFPVTLCTMKTSSITVSKTATCNCTNSSSVRMQTDKKKAERRDFLICLWSRFQH